jgi:RHS repeat-associated protein
MSDGRYLYNGKEKQITGELNYLDYGARMYDDEIGRWFGLDPLAERHYDMSPYIFSGNNPMRYVDIDGRDWYEDVYKNVMWRQGSDDVEGYTNIGSSYTLDAGGGLSITYDQMDVTSMTFTGANASNWVSQISEGINCHEASSQILQNAGAETAGRGSEILVTALGSDGRAGDANSNAGNGFSEIDRTIEGGNPIIVGVDYKDGSPNADKMTDHFIVISSKTEALKNGKTTSTTYNYFDPRTSKKSYGISPNNVLMINNNYMKGSYIHGGRNDGYTVTTVRRNK